MRVFLASRFAKALVFSFISELTFVALFITNYSSALVGSITSLSSVPLFATLTDRIGAVSSGSQVQILLGAFSPALANAISTCFVWSLINGAFLVSYAITQYRN